MINDMRINQPGTTRIKEISKFKINRGLIAEGDAPEKAPEDKSSYNVDKLLFLPLDSSAHENHHTFILCATDTQVVNLIEFGTFKEAYKFQFKSTYSRPKKKQSIHHKNSQSFV